MQEKPQSEEICTMLRIIEDKAGAGVDRRCPGISSRINDLSCMKLKGFELWLSFPTT